MRLRTRNASVALAAALGLAACTDRGVGGGGNNETDAPAEAGDGDDDDDKGDDGVADDDKGDGDDDGKGDAEPPLSCGDGVKNQGEACDGTDLGGLTCIDLGFFDGELACADCQLDKSSCAEPPPGSEPTCGDGIKQPGEGCDGVDIGGLTCADFGADEGGLGCTAACELSFDDCGKDDKGENCGNGQLDPGETCDGDLGGLACTDLGFAGGTLSCDPSYCFLDTSACE